MLLSLLFHCVCFFFNDTATTEIYTLSLHDALPIYLHEHDLVVLTDAAAADGAEPAGGVRAHVRRRQNDRGTGRAASADRKSTRLNSSHITISYAVFCLKKKKTQFNLNNVNAFNAIE